MLVYEGEKALVVARLVVIETHNVICGLINLELLSECRA